MGCVVLSSNDKSTYEKARGCRKGEEIRVTEDRGPKKHVGDDMKNTTNEH